MKEVFVIVLCFSVQFIFSQDNKAYTPHEVDTFPQFEGNPCSNNANAEGCFKDQVIRHVSKVVRYPKEALLNKEEGAVYLQFEVDSIGVVKNIRARSKKEDFKKEAIRAIGLLSNLKPATKDGKNVPFVFAVPVHFVLPKSQTPQIDYFPQELLIHPDVMDQKNGNQYLDTFIKNKIIAIVNQKSNLSVIRKYSKDTLSIRLSFQVDSDGRVQNKENQVQINSRKLAEKFSGPIGKIPTSLPKFKVLNRKADTIASVHYFNYLFLPPKEKNSGLEEVPTNKKYEGGTILEIPVFPGCENLSYEKSKHCFQLMMQDHIKRHFRYPEEALRTRKSGKVNIVFEISKKGTIENIRTKGPHSILKKEAVRIIQQLPLMTPAKNNGKPVDIPFSIPITFKL
ncbi:MAG: energy transducer TonB [Allomuricauda sp.]